MTRLDRRQTAPGPSDRSDRRAARARRSSVIDVCAIVVVALMLGACEVTEQRKPRMLVDEPPTTKVQRPESVATPPPAATSSQRLHEICGRILIYYLEHRSLPTSLDTLAAMEPADANLIRCPESGRRYFYLPQGLDLPYRKGHLFIYSPTRVLADTESRATAQPPQPPSRWAVLIDEPQPGSLTTQVILLPETELQAALAGSRPARAVEP